MVYLWILVAAAGASYLLWLDHALRTRFDGQRWDLSARVFARPLEIHVGQRMDAARVTGELALLGYRRVAVPAGPGEFARDGARLRLHTRGFEFRDGVERAVPVTVEFADGAVVRLAGAGGKRLPLLRLEPLEIAQIVPTHSEDRMLVRLEQVPDALIQALVATEDKRFFTHHGVDFVATVRAALANLRAGTVRQGGSTLTQQLVKNMYLDAERTLWRKINEALMAVLMELRYDKRAILEAYVNEVYLGQDGRRAIHGFALAAWFHYGRPLAELGTADLALLAGLVRGPSYYDPRRHPQRSLQRRNEVLGRMAARGFLERATAARLQAAPLGLRPAAAPRNRFPDFMQLVRRQLRREYRERDLRSAGLRIFTTLDPQLQERLQNALDARLRRLERARGLDEGTLEAALVVAEVASGQVRALLGGRREGGAGFNRALDARRPVGSLIKPAVYLAALRDGRYTLASRIEEQAVNWRDAQGRTWTPRNYDRRLHGEVTLAQALAHSYNVATVQLGLALGFEPVLRTLGDLGFEPPLPRYPSLFLGAIERTPVQVADMYLTLANSGYRTPLRPILEVTGGDGRALRAYTLEIRAAVPAPAAFLVQHMLELAAGEGTARAAAAALPGLTPVAGKTGTTDDLRDAWFAGYAGDLLAVVWVGRDDNRPAGLTGAAGALPLWVQIMRAARPAPVAPAPPEGVQWRWIDAGGARAVAAGCKGARRTPFLIGTAPQPLGACGGAAGSGPWRAPDR